MPLGAVTLLAVGLTVGGPPSGPVTLAWTAPPGCPAGEAVLAATHRLLDEVAAQGPARAVAAPVEARGRIVGEAGRWTLTLTLATGERVIESERCEPLAETAALLLAIAVDPRVLGDGGSGGAPVAPPLPLEPAPAPEPPPIVGSPPPIEDVPSGDPEDGIDVEDRVDDRVEPPTREDEGRDALPTVERPKGWAMALRALGGVGLGVLPRVAATAGVAVAFEREILRIEALGTFWGPANATSPANAAVGGRFLLGTAGLRACAVTPPLGAGAASRRPGSLRTRVLFCGGGEVGAVRGKGEGAIRANVARSPIAAVTVGLGARFDLGRDGAIVLDAAVVYAPLRPRFHTEPSGELWEAGPVGGRFGVGVELGGLLQKALAGGQPRSRR